MNKIGPEIKWRRKDDDEGFTMEYDAESKFLSRTYPVVMHVITHP